MFTYDHYKNTCLKYVDEGYKFSKLDDNRSPKSIWMVHDCDSFIENAVNLSRLENEIGVKSTYFLRLRARAYNVFSPYTVNLCRTIIDAGHDVGLHYEPINNMTIKDMMSLVSHVLDYPVRFFNIHEPARTGIDIKALLPLNNRCYNSKYFENVKYISDSGGRWREGCFSEHVNRWDQILVSTHPVWWYEQTPARNY